MFIITITSGSFLLGVFISPASEHTWLAEMLMFQAGRACLDDQVNRGMFWKHNCHIVYTSGLFGKEPKITVVFA